MSLGGLSSTSLNCQLKELESPGKQRRRVGGWVGVLILAGDNAGADQLHIARQSRAFSAFQ